MISTYNTEDNRVGSDRLIVNSECCGFAISSDWHINIVVQYHGHVDVLQTRMIRVAKIDVPC